MEFLESEEFYDLMQAYRHAPLGDQKLAAKAFEAVKTYIRDQISKLKEDL